MGHKQAGILWRPKRIVSGGGTPFFMHSAMGGAPSWVTNRLAHSGARKVVSRGASPYFIYSVKEASPSWPKQAGAL